MKKAVIILPTYNEAENIEQLLSDIFDVAKGINQWTIEILVVDSNSPDKTAETVKSLQKKYKNLYILETPKEGLGKAYIRGFNYALNEMKAYVVFEMDADFSHDPKLIPDFLEKIQAGADFVIGSRYRKGGSIPADWGWDRKLFSIVGNWIIRLGFMKMKVTDWTSGFRAIKSWVIKSTLDDVKNYTGYVFQVAILDTAVKLKAVIDDVPLNFIDRKEGVSKMQSSQYILQTLLYVFTHSPFVKFVIVGLIGFAIDFTFAYIFIHALHIHKPTANAFSAEIAIISNFFLNNFWSFRHKQVVGGAFAFIKKLLSFNLISSGSIAIQWIGMFLTLKIFGDHIIHFGDMISIPSWTVYKACIIAIVIIPYSYILYNKVVWKDK